MPQPGNTWPATKNARVRPLRIEMEGATYRSPECPVGRYRLELLARGGSGCAYSARLGQRLLFVKEVPISDRQHAEHLRSEARTLQRLPLGNFPRFVEHFEQEGHAYLVTEFVEGQTLEREVRVNPWVYPENEELKCLARGLCEQLEVLHGLKPPLLYLDMKPANVIRNPQGKLYLVDFGIARTATDPGGEQQGSPLTASPEHYTGKVDVRSDLFSMAATVYYVATRGQFQRSDWGAFPPATDFHPDLPADMLEWLQRCLELDPDRRFSSVEQARQALDVREEKPPGTAPKRSWLPWKKA